MGSISSKGREKAADVGENGLKEGQPPFSISSKLDHYDQGLGTNQSPDQAVEIGDVGGRGNMTVQNDELKKVIEQGRKEIKETQEKLNSSLTTPIVESEAKIIEDGNWLGEVKDLNRRFNALPPIDMGKKVKGNGAMAFTID